MAVEKPKTAKTESAPKEAPVVVHPTPGQTNGLAVAAMVVGIVGFVFGWTPFFGFIAGVAALILGIIALKKSPALKGMSITGIVLGGIAALWGLVVTVILIISLATLSVGGVTTSAAFEQAAREAQAEIDRAKDSQTQTDANKTWTEVYKFSGTSSKRSDTFHLTGADARLKYVQTGETYGTTIVYIVDEGDSLEESGGFPEVTIVGNKDDSTRVVKSAGNYYFDVTSSSASWTVTIEEAK